MKGISMESEEYFLGRIAYEAYCETSEWKSLISGHPLPQFHDTSEPIKKAWINSAQAVKRMVTID